MQCLQHFVGFTVKMSINHTLPKTNTHTHKMNVLVFQKRPFTQSECPGFWKLPFTQSECPGFWKTQNAHCLLSASLLKHIGTTLSPKQTQTHTQSESVRFWKMQRALHFVGFAVKVHINPTLPKTNTNMHTKWMRLFLKTSLHMKWKSSSLKHAMFAAFCQLHC